ncbi:MAG: hypothetical protein R2737_17160 [Candidatus Nanopelagicales bacterium]
MMRAVDRTVRTKAIRGPVLAMTDTTRTGARPDVDLSDELWTWHHVAAFFHRARTATFALMAQEWFPAPLDLGAAHGDRVYLAAEVRDAVASRPRRTHAPRRRPAPRRPPSHNAAEPTELELALTVALNQAVAQ